MDILFIHGNYPAQFRHLASALGACEGNRVVFLTSREDAELDTIKGVRIAKFKQHRAVTNGVHHYIASTEEAVLQGQAVIKALDSLQQEGFRPRFVVSHAGVGLGLFIKEFMPYTTHIGYFEWYFKSETARYLVEDYDVDKRLMTVARNMPILQELEGCDVGVVPTQYQYKQFPVEYRSKLRVIFDGIDERFFFHAEEESLKEDRVIRDRESGEEFRIGREETIVTYATRGMEPIRCFPEFLEAIKEVMKRREDIRIVIAGKDRCAYSYRAPGPSGSWKEFMIKDLGEEYLERISFTGLLSYEDYRWLLWRSDLHCYLTRPYVTSWSLFEAGFCGSSLLVSRGDATKGILKEGSVNWVELDDEVLAERILESLNAGRKKAKIVGGFSLEESLRDWQDMLVSLLQ